MTSLAVTFPMGWPSHHWQDLDVVAEVGPDGIEEVFAHDYKTNTSETISGPLEADIRSFIEIERRAELAQAEDEARAGKTAYDREVSRSAA